MIAAAPLRRVFGDFAASRRDWVPGLLAALLTLPQAIALATLAGMPVENGLYLSLLPALAATLIGHSRVALSGPNTAASILLYASAATFATPGSAGYVNQVLLTTFFAAIFQFAFYFLRVGRLFLDLPLSVTQGIIAGTGALILSQQVGPLLGVVINGQGPVESLGQALAYDAKNAWPLAVGGVGVAAGLWSKRHRLGRYHLLIALAAGWLSADLCDLLFGSATTAIDRLGRMNLTLHFLSVPSVDWTELVALFAAVSNGMAVAAVGSLQAAIMARTTSVMVRERLNVNRDILGQGAMNLIATFTSGLAGATSFNRTLANIETGARSRAAGVIGVVVLAIALSVAQEWLARIPLAAVCGVLVLVGLSLLGSLRSIDRKHPRRAIEMLATIASAIFLGLFYAVLVGACLTLYHRALDREESDR
ncbi:MAG: SulP family inorganic anion transporter [Rhodocyclales bacterium]|nr:SulP family inorganic anion transporter [Rhodocyclales bacterium]